MRYYPSTVYNSTNMNTNESTINQDSIIVPDDIDTEEMHKILFTRGSTVLL